MTPPAEDHEPLPGDLRPMLTVAGPLPSGPGWAYEMKWDGVRALVALEEGRVRIRSRNGADVTASYPELLALRPTRRVRSALFDGEIVAFDGAGRPSFSLLGHRLHVGDARRARRLAERLPVAFLAFDLLHLDGAPVRTRPYAERRQALEGLGLSGPAWDTPPSFGGPGPQVVAAASSCGLEGVVAKAVADPYRPGERSRSWIKVKQLKTQEVVVGGWTPGQGWRRASVGALLLGLPEAGGLRYVGKVGTGFTEAALADLRQKLEELARPQSPFTAPLPRNVAAAARWATPTMVGEVACNGWTPEGRLRQPTWRGLRPDKAPSEVFPEG